MAFPKRFASPLYSGSALLLLLAGAPISAQVASSAGSTLGDGDDEISDIVVTARKRAERLQDVPEVISVLSEEALASKGVANFNDLGRQTPGITMNQRQTTIPNVTVRGVGAFGNVQGVAFYLDDAINFTDPTARLEDLERVEILKGPQGTLYGGASLGGAIRYISKAPVFETKAEVKAEIGENDFQNYYAAVNLPVSDVVAVRMSGFYNHDDSYIRDLNLNKNTNRKDEYQVRGQILFQPSSDFKALLTVRYHHLKTGLAYTRADRVDQPVYTTTHPFLPFIEANTWAGNLTLNYDFGGATLTSITSATRQVQYQRLNLTYRPTGGAELFTAGHAHPGKVFTQELRLTSREGGTLDWIMGAYAQRTENTVVTLSPQFLRTPAGTTLYFDYQTRENTIAGFGTANLHLGDLTITGGARLEHTAYKADIATTVTAAVNRTLTNGGTILLPKASLTYRPSRNLTLFATVAKGYISGKVEPTVNPPSTFKREENWTFEAGLKGSLAENLLSYEFTGFYIRESDRQASNYINLPGGIVVRPVSTIGDSTAKGAEASFVLRPVQHLSLDGSIAYLDSQWSSDARYAGVSIAGRRTPVSPKWTANAGATYAADLSNSLKFSLHADIAYTSRFEWSLDYPIANSNPSYALVFLRGALGSIDDTWEVAARVENLFDKRYWSELTPVAFGAQRPDGSCNGCGLGAAAQPRRFIFSVSSRF